METVDCTPVWLMRQAGRYLPEYRDLRAKYSMLTMCKTPELAAEVTLQPLRRFPLDAAIIFADILLPVEPMGLHLEFAKGEGPVLQSVSSLAEVEQLKVFEPRENLKFVLDAIRIVTRELKIPLIGFAGAPFTVASYIIEGGYSRHFLKTKQFMQQQPEAWHLLMEKLSNVTTSYLNAQVEAGAAAVQLFDSWVGVVSPAAFKEFILPYSKRILDSLGVPSIHFSTGTSGYLNLIAQAGGSVISVDWRISLDHAWQHFPERAIQGNLDPASLLKSHDELLTEVDNVLKEAAGRRGHIFNLGHGVFPETPISNVEALIERVHGHRL
jgi:uroporphyrinogen decarboxylase